MVELLGILVLAAIVWAAVKSSRSAADAEDLAARVARLEREVAWLRGQPSRRDAAPETPRERQPDHPYPEAPPPIVPPAPPPAPERLGPVRPPAFPVATRATTPEPAPPPPLPPPPRSVKPAVDWEKFLGVQLFAWLGGFALFLGAAFFVKYSIEHDLISPLMRVLISFLVGAGVIVGGLLLRPRGYAVTVEALCAAGVTILYADIFAARSFYHFVPTSVAFGLMVLVTATAFLLALRLDARYVAVLGLLGGYLTPYLLSTGEDRPVGLFGYVLLLDIGLLAIMLKKRWDFLAPLAAAGTLALQVGWTAKFFTPGKAGTAVGIWSLFAFLFLGAGWLAGRIRARGLLLESCAAVPALAAMLFAGYLVQVPTLGARPGLVLGFLTLVLAGVALLSLLEPGFEQMHAAASALGFLVLLGWTSAHLTEALLHFGLFFFLAYAILAAVFPLLLARVRRDAAPPPWAGWVPLLALLLFIVPALKHLTGVLLWPALLLVDAAALAAAWATGAAAAAGLVVVLTFVPMAVWIATARAGAELPSLLGVVALFSLALFAAGLLRQRREGRAAGAPAPRDTAAAGEGALRGFAELPALAALLPFLLLVPALLQLRPADPSPIFGMALLLTILLLALVRLRGVDLLGLTALLATALVVSVDSLSRDGREVPWALPGWYLLFILLHLAFPFLFARRLEQRVLPWMTAALAGPVFFWPLHRAVVALLGKDLIGLLPAALALPCLAGLSFLVRALPKESPARLAQSAWFGGASLFFVTLIFPLQFSREWITLGWALEGAALVWLCRRVPHPGLLLWAAALLATAFVRLALNPAVVHYHPRAALPILNWYLYAYGVTAGALFAAARLLPEGEAQRVEGVPLRPVFRALGTVLLFLLVNIEIADYFSTGATLTFRFSGSFALDMTYSLAWGTFALVLLLAGIRAGSKAARLASLGLFAVTIAKVFLHDLWRLGQLYRVGSVIALAVLLILVSFLYQRFIAPEFSASRRGRERGGDETSEETRG